MHVCTEIKFVCLIAVDIDSFVSLLQKYIGDCLQQVTFATSGSSPQIIKTIPLLAGRQTPECIKQFVIILRYEIIQRRGIGLSDIQEQLPH